MLSARAYALHQEQLNTRAWRTPAPAKDFCSSTNHKHTRFSAADEKCAVADHGDVGNGQHPPITCFLGALWREYMVGTSNNMERLYDAGLGWWARGSGARSI